MSAPVTVTFALHPAQLEVFQDDARFIVLIAGRRFGKSYLACVRAITSAMDPANVRRLPVWIVAPVQPQAKQIYWSSLLELTKPLRAANGDGVHVNEATIALLNGVTIAIKGADRPDTMLGSGLFDVILDEFAYMKPTVWNRVIRPMLADVKGRALFIGTPDAKGWHFTELYKKAKLGLDPDWAAFHFKTIDNPFIPREEIEAARRDMSSAMFRQEFEASFETGGGGQMKEEWLKFCDEPSRKTALGTIEPIPGNLYVVADLHGFGDVAKGENHRTRQLDRTAIATVKVLENKDWWVKDIAAGRWGVEEVARRIVDAVVAAKVTMVGIEKGALFNAASPYIVAEAAKRKVYLTIVPLSHENKSKADRIMWALQGRFEHGRISLAVADWNRDFTDEFVHFPSTAVHDDMMDALAYIVQIAEHDMFDAYGEEQEASYFQPLDTLVGY